MLTHRELSTHGRRVITAIRSLENDNVDPWPDFLRGPAEENQEEINTVISESPLNGHSHPWTAFSSARGFEHGRTLVSTGEDKEKTHRGNNSQIA